MSNREQLQLAHTSTAALRQVILFPDRRTTLASFFRRRRLFRHCCSAYVASGPGSLLLRSGPSYGDMTFLRRMEARAHGGAADCRACPLPVRHLADCLITANHLQPCFWRSRASSVALQGAFRAMRPGARRARAPGTSR